jgi:uncharacterized protein (DUF2062 family)
MPRRLLKQYLPTPEALKAHSALRPLGRLLHNPEIWHLHRRSVSGAFFIGLFCAALPIPFQMLVAGAIAVASRCSLPISVALVWVTNPLTIPPYLYFAYTLGASLLGTQLTVDRLDLDFGQLSGQLAEVWKPVLLGSLVCGLVGGVLAFVFVRVGWRIHVMRRWQVRRAQRRAAAGPTIPSA